MSGQRSGLFPAPPSVALPGRSPEAGAAPRARVPAAGTGARPAVAQLKKKKKKAEPRSHERAANAVMAGLGVGPNTTSRTGAIAQAFLSKGLRSLKGESGSLRSKLMDHAYGRAADAAEGKQTERPSLSSLVAGHFKDALKQRFASSQLGQAYGMAQRAGDAADRRGRIAQQKAAGGGVRDARAAARAAPEEEPELGGLFHETATPASGEPPDPAAPPPPQEPAVQLERDPPLAPISVSQSGSLTQAPPPSKDDDEAKS